MFAATPALMPAPFVKTGIREAVSGIRTAIDLLIGKMGEFETRLAVIEERSKH